MSNTYLTACGLRRIEEELEWIKSVKLVELEVQFNITGEQITLDERNFYINRAELLEKMVDTAEIIQYKTKLSNYKNINIGDIIKSNRNEFDLTIGKLYSALGNPTGLDMIAIKNDKGIIDLYSVDYFDLYIQD